MHIAPFIPHNIITFVIEFSRNSHLSDFQCTLFSSDLRESQLGGATAPFAPLPRGDANEDSR